jgi:tryptophanyl-tRNA synthetase
MARVFSGIQPTGDVHLGNYLGAIRRWAEGQPPAGSQAAQRGDAIYCVVDLHALTVAFEPADVRARTRALATLLMAAGLEPDRCLLFVQSHVRAHAELTWILNNVATFGELNRMTQFKEKAAAQESVTAGLFDYPVLMASDILLYDTEEVPVGDDQRQHVELARDIAIRFNHRFGDTFVVPKATFSKVAARVMDLQNPSRKMSKSEDSPQGTILVLDPPKTIEKKIKSAVTDSETDVRYDPEHKPGVSNLLEIYSVTSGTSIPEAEAAFAGSGYGKFKLAVAEAVVECLRPVQERYAELEQDPAEVARRLKLGAEGADAKAELVLARAKDAAGLLPRPA